MKIGRLKNPFLIVIVTITILSGCLADYSKPTGLENTSENHLSSKENNEDQSNIELQKETEVQENNSEDNAQDTVNNNDETSLEKSNQGNDEKVSGTVKENKNTSNEVSQSKISTSTKKETNNKNPKTHKPKKSESTSKKQQPKEKKDPPKEEPVEENTSSTITHSIVIAAEGSYGQKVCQEKKYYGCPEDGRAEIPLPPTVMEIEDEDTVLEALIAITMKQQIHMDYRGGQGATAYIQGMGNVYEFDRGQGSGWMYRINGVFPDRGAGVVPLCDGDVVEWLYTTNLGRDLNADLQPVRRDGKCP